jgi:type 1 fimbriae regulatory protein FimB/type 1 fimbriae regulatory protein FimE
LQRTAHEIALFVKRARAAAERCIVKQKDRVVLLTLTKLTPRLCFYLVSRGHDTRAIQAYLGHKNIQHTVRYTELSPKRFQDFWND